MILIIPEDKVIKRIMMLYVGFPKAIKQIFKISLWLFFNFSYYMIFYYYFFT